MLYLLTGQFMFMTRHQLHHPKRLSMAVMYQWVFMCGMQRGSHLVIHLAITKMVAVHICVCWPPMRLDIRVPVQLVLSF